MVPSGSYKTCGSEVTVLLPLKPLIPGEDGLQVPDELRVLRGLGPRVEVHPAVDAIKEVGVGNDFIGHETTMDNMDLPSDPLVINRDMIGDWRAAGCKNLAEAAHDVVEDVLKNHTVEPLTPEVDAAMKAIVKKADDEFLKEA